MRRCARNSRIDRRSVVFLCVCIDYWVFSVSNRVDEELRSKLSRAYFPIRNSRSMSTASSWRGSSVLYLLDFGYVRSRRSWISFAFLFCISVFWLLYIRLELPRKCRQPALVELHPFPGYAFLAICNNCQLDLGSISYLSVCTLIAVYHVSNRDGKELANQVFARLTRIQKGKTH